MEPLEQSENPNTRIRYPLEEQKKYAKNYLELCQIQSKSKSCRDLGVRKETLDRWVSLFFPTPAATKRPYRKKQQQPTESLKPQPTLIHVPIAEDANKRILVSLLENSISNLKTILEILTER